MDNYVRFDTEEIDYGKLAVGVARTLESAVANDRSEDNNQNAVVAAAASSSNKDDTIDSEAWGTTLINNLLASTNKQRRNVLDVSSSTPSLSQQLQQNIEAATTTATTISSIKTKVKVEEEEDDEEEEEEEHPVVHHEPPPPPPPPPQKRYKRGPQTEKTAAEKLKILTELDGPNSPSIASLAQKYGVNRKTIHRWKKNKEKFVELVEKKRMGKCKRIYNDPLIKIKDAVDDMYRKSLELPQDQRLPVTGSVVAATAMQAAEKILARHAREPFLSKEELEEISKFKGSESWGRVTAHRMRMNSVADLQGSSGGAGASSSGTSSGRGGGGGSSNSAAAGSGNGGGSDNVVANIDIEQITRKFFEQQQKEQQNNISPNVDDDEEDDDENNKLQTRQVNNNYKSDDDDDDDDDSSNSATSTNASSSARPIIATADLCDEYVTSPDRLKVVNPSPVFFSYGRVTSFFGEIYTVRCFESNPLVRKTLCQKGDGRVLVVDGGASQRVAILGDQLAELARDNNWAGIVINGYIRDSKVIGSMEVGVKALGTHPLKSIKKHQGEGGVIVSFSGVEFVPGHWLYSDEDGIVISERPLHNLPSR